MAWDTERLAAAIEERRNDRAFMRRLDAFISQNAEVLERLSTIEDDILVPGLGDALMAFALHWKPDVSIQIRFVPSGRWSVIIDYGEEVFQSSALEDNLARAIKLALESCQFAWDDYTNKAAAIIDFIEEAAAGDTIADLASTARDLL